MSSIQLSGGTFSSFFESFFAPQRSPHTPNLPPPESPLAIRVPARCQEKSFPFSGDFLMLAGDCGRVNPNNLPNSTIAADHQTAYKGMLSRISKNYKHVFLISGNNEPRTLRGGWDMIVRSWGVRFGVGCDLMRHQEPATQDSGLARRMQSIMRGLSTRLLG
ncbi:hypothetical protein NA56DRAFT_703662 [Hyaloscypha hepaticicola]|uniref:Uncharacterized protein n=1 Tax=Hyaloscypha hepaticicola TaxID=2082293 RepID=A0A2J6Q5C9_9HELO|nr:hypothetical protein NA56DRAFT_703662 [Hyaloscypha hepaticicola]